MTPLRTGLAWLRATDLLVLVAILVAVLSLWTFIAIADRVREGDAPRLDAWILQALRNPSDPSDPIGPPLVEEALRDLTALGGPTVLGLVTAVVLGYLALIRKSNAAALVVMAALGGLLLSILLKGLFDRPRPDIVPHLAPARSSSFPSGHSMLAAVIYLTLGALLDRIMDRAIVRLYILVVALLLCFLVGVSRVYLGVHYPTDVLAGWAVGLAWAIFCWLTARWLQQRGIIEKPLESGG